MNFLDFRRKQNQIYRDSLKEKDLKKFKYYNLKNSYKFQYLVKHSIPYNTKYFTSIRMIMSSIHGNNPVYTKPHAYIVENTQHHVWKPIKTYIHTELKSTSLAWRKIKKLTRYYDTYVKNRYDVIVSTKYWYKSYLKKENLNIETNKYNYMYYHVKNYLIYEIEYFGDMVVKHDNSYYITDRRYHVYPALYFNKLKKLEKEIETYGIITLRTKNINSAYYSEIIFHSKEDRMKYVLLNT